ncbi:Zinc finger protein DZIP1L [Phytophthora citrophthora]|uniref:Zinc finger protein DZIP1L n=1 Tax=Phytophthora citrophthora TaxID=4793 RepID=A0AAD9G647_9STRA|nr:Zinc finger protein DZIP1L [Phytophthora citrophthora]
MHNSTFSLSDRMRRFCWRERSERLNWRLLGALDVADVVRRGDPALLESYALHITFARLPSTPNDQTRDAWFLVRVLQLSMEYLLFMRSRDGDVLESLSQELRQVENERDEMVVAVQKWKIKARSGDKQVEKLHQVLQNIAKLLQIHGASPSAVATIETLLTELIAERRAKQKRRKLMEKSDDEAEEQVIPVVQEARVCGFCGKLFSSAEYLEKHLVRRHDGESIAVETPVKYKMKEMDYEEDNKENQVRNEDAAASEVAMQKMVQQVEKALQEHEERLRSLAGEEAEKIKRFYGQLYTETKLAEEIKSLKAEQQRNVSQRQLDELCSEKQRVEDELTDLKQQIQFLTLKRNMMGTVANVDASRSLPHKSDNENELLAAEIEIKSLQETLETVNAELSSAREELAKVQALHLSALRKKKDLADELVLARGDSVVERQENSSQTEPCVTLDEAVQTDQQKIPIGSESKVPARVGIDVGTDPLVLNYEDVGIQTINLLQSPSVADAEVQVAIADDQVLTNASVSNPELISQSSPTADADVDTEYVVIPEKKDNERLPDNVQQIHTQDLLDVVVQRAQRAASNIVLSDIPVSRNCSSISRHKFVRSRFQHDEDTVKDRVASCLAKLELFSHRFGVAAKSAYLSEASLQLVQKALHGHLGVLPTEVLSKMVERENAVNEIIVKEWAPMEKTRQEALERFKLEIRAKSEITQGLVRQAMAALGGSVRESQPSGTGGEVVTVNEGNSCNVVELPTESVAGASTAQISDVSGKNDSETAPARRYSANNQLTVVVGGKVTTESTNYLTEEDSNFQAQNDNFAIGSTEDVEKAHTSSNVPDTIGDRDEGASSLGNKSTKSSADPSVQSEQEMVDAVLASPVEPKTAPIETRPIQLATTTTGHRNSPETNFLAAKTNSAELSASESPSTRDAQVSVVKNVGDKSRSEWGDEEQKVGAQWDLQCVGFSSDLEAKSHISTDHPDFTNSPQPSHSVDSVHLSSISEFAATKSSTGLDRSLSVMSSEISFATSIPSLGGEDESVKSSTSAVTTGAADSISRRSIAEDVEESAASFSPTDTPAREISNDSVMSFDDSDIEEVVLT